MSSNKQFRKKSRQTAQQAAVDLKAMEDDTYFWNCVSKNAKGRNSRKSLQDKSIFGEFKASGIDFAKYDAIPVSRSGPSDGCNEIASLDNFLALSKVLPNFLHLNLTAKHRMNYQVPTPIQKHTVPISLDGRYDCMACAQTGSGKTVAFLVPLIAWISLSATSVVSSKSSRSASLPTPAQPKAMIIAPTRELAIQIELEAQKLTFQSKLRTVCIYGGAATRGQLENLSHGVDILVGTPGRLTDFLSRELISLQNIKFLVLDEADRMLDMGFEPQIRKICEAFNMPSEGDRRTLMFSATFPEAMQRIASKYMREYVFVAVGRVGSTTDSITQSLIKAERNDKRLKLSLILPLVDKTEKTIIFVMKKHNADWVKREIEKNLRGICCESIHGDRTQQQREAALDKFRKSQCQCLIATDVAARGLDIDDVTMVVQMDLPNSKEEFDNYVHRIGRTGRAGNKGKAFALYVPGDDKKQGQNGNIWEPLFNLLKETKQIVPEWFRACQHAGGRKSIGASDSGKSKEPQRDTRSKGSVFTQIEKPSKDSSTLFERSGLSGSRGGDIGGLASRSGHGSASAHRRGGGSAAGRGKVPPSASGRGTSSERGGSREGRGRGRGRGSDGRVSRGRGGGRGSGIE
jgi:ATP-dependent RNA helicase DDX3X